MPSPWCDVFTVKKETLFVRDFHHSDSGRMGFMVVHQLFGQWQGIIISDVHEIISQHNDKSSFQQRLLPELPKPRGWLWPDEMKIDRCYQVTNEVSQSCLLLSRIVFQFEVRISRSSIERWPSLLRQGFPRSQISEPLLRWIGSGFVSDWQHFLCQALVAGRKRPQTSREVANFLTLVI